MASLLRIIMLALVIWGIWRIYTALYPPRRPPRTDKGQPDEWQDVLEAIDELPEASDPHLRVRDHDQPPQHQRRLTEGARPNAAIESTMVHEAEVALSLVREGDENERLAAYYEIATYEKLCSMADGHVSDATRQKIGDLHQRALEMICPPDDDYA